MESNQITDSDYAVQSPRSTSTAELQTVLMTPSQATEAWLSWGREDEAGRLWEHKDRHDLKRKLFGNPPRGTVAKAETLTTELIAQMEANDDWPMTLRWFVNELTMRKGSEDRVGTS